MIHLSGLVITYNEEHNIERCLSSLWKVCDEVIVIDSNSNDQTREIALKLNSKVIINPFPGHIEQKNFAVSKASHDYVLSIDADEELSDELVKQIQKFKRSVNADALKFNRVTRYVDQWIYHCDWYPDTKLRLWKKELGKWGGVNPHDIVQISKEAKVIKLKGDLRHYSYNSISEHIQQTDKFTTIAAKAAYNNGVRSSIFKIVTRPFLKFLKDYFLRLGILDGKYGFIICYINSLSALLKYSKIKDLQDGKQI